MTGKERKNLEDIRTREREESKKERCDGGIWRKARLTILDIERSGKIEKSSLVLPWFCM